MKLTLQNNKRAKCAKGMTLLELTVVILVLLSLISILFIGARAWKRGSDRAGNILSVRNVQQAVRAHSNMNGLNPGQSVLYHETIFAGSDADSGLSDLVGLNYMEEPTPPSGSGIEGYVYLNIVPAMGDLYIVNAALGKPGGEYFFPGSAGDSYGGKVGGW